MRAAIYSPYLDTLGGGERYVTTVAQSLINLGYAVDVQWKDLKIKKKLEDRFGIDLSSVNFIADIKRGEGYEVCFWLSDGSLPLLKARKNILHFQIPFKGVDGRSLLNKMKFFRINQIVCNSKFTKGFIDKEFGVKSKVVYPPIQTTKFKSGKKEDLILYVGRFSKLKQSKRQDVLIEVFKKLFDSGFDDWKLILAGGTEVGTGDYLEELKESARNYPIKFITSPSFEKLKDCFARAKIFWSAAGYGVDEKKEPEKVEHFGITPVEAMSAKAVPIIFAAGGHKETVENGKNGFLWKTTKELLGKTKDLIRDPQRLKKLALQAQKDSQQYSYARFEKEIKELL